MELTNKTIREIALASPATTRIFEELKIDYCCGGHVNFKDACETANVDLSEVEAKIADAINSGQLSSDDDFSAQVSPSKLIEMIVAKHHVYTKNELERLNPLLEKVIRKHGEAHPELLDIGATFIKLSDDLLPHMEKEEHVLFPYIRNLEASDMINISVPKPPFGTVQNPIRMMRSEHDAAGGFLKHIRKLSNDFTAPENACPSFKALFFGLEELEKDLHRHIHLENNILFPLASELEEKSLTVSA